MVNRTAARRVPLRRAFLAIARAAPGSIIAAIIVTHAAAKNPNEPGRVATPMSMPFMSQAAATQHAAASPSVAVSMIVGTAVLRGATFTIAFLRLRADPASSLTSIRGPAGRDDLSGRRAGCPSRARARRGTAAPLAWARNGAGTAPGAVRPVRPSPGPPPPAAPGAWRSPDA